MRRLAPVLAVLSAAACVAPASNRAASPIEVTEPSAPATSPAPLLRSRVDHARAALAAVRLQPALLLRPLAERRERLAALVRVAGQLHPERPLQRGYVMVLDAAGAALTDAARAAREAAMTLKFRDGTLDVVPASAPPRRKSAPPPSGEQPKLL